MYFLANKFDISMKIIVYLALVKNTKNVFMEKNKNYNVFKIWLRTIFDYPNQTKNMIPQFNLT